MMCVVCSHGTMHEGTYFVLVAEFFLPADANKIQHFNNF